MNRREFIATVGCAALAPASARAQQQQRTRPLVAWVDYLLASDHHLSDLFVQVMQEIGYVEGSNYDFAERHAELQPEKLDLIARDLVALKPDVIVAESDATPIAIARQTKAIPIIALAVNGDPVDAGLIHSFPHPGSNVSGISWEAPGLATKWLQLLIELQPNVRRIAVLSDPETQSKLQAAEAAAAGRSRGIDMVLFDLRPSDDVDKVFAAIAAAQCEVLETVSAPGFGGRAQAMTAASIKYRLPAVFANPNFVSAGGLIVYEPAMVDIWRRGAAMVKKVLDGQSIATIPFELPEKFELTINLKTAKEIGITVPDTLLALADSVVE